MNLIILHDYRLFVQRMHYIWKRFVNVVFVREYEQSFRNRNSSSTANIKSFELVTVPFPLPIVKDVFVSKHLDFWRDGRYSRGTELTADKTKNLDGKMFWNF